MERQMTFQESVSTCLKKYVDFKGRARRSEYWWFALFNFVVSYLASWISPTLGYIVCLALLLPGLAVCVRRLQDLGKDWYWILLALIPIVGAIILLIMFCKEGERQPNRFGPDPKA